MRVPRFIISAMMVCIAAAAFCPRGAHGQDSDETTLLAKVFELEDHRAPASQLLPFAAPDQPAEVRRRAVIALGENGDPDAADLLLLLAVDSDETLAATAITALERLWYPNIREGIGNAPDDRVLDLLESMLSDAHSFKNAKAGERLRARAAWAFARIADRERAPALMPVLNRALVAGPDPALADQAKAAIEGLYRHKVKGARDIIVLATGHADPSVRMHAAVALGRLGDSSARSALETLLNDPDRAVRIEAGRAIGKLGGPSSPALPARLLFSDDPAEIIGGLLAYGKGAVGVPIDRATQLLAAAAENDDHASPVQLAVLDALGRRADPTAVGLLAAQVKRGGAFRARTFRALGQAQAADLLLDISAESLTGDPIAASEYVQALAACGMKPATDRLSELIEQPARPAVFRTDSRGVFALIYAASQANAAAFQARLREYLTDDTALVRAVAADYVTEKPDIVYIDPLIDGLRMSQAPDQTDAALSALAALGAVGKTIEGASFAKRRVVDEVEPFLNDPRRAVRIRAAESLSQLTGRRVTTVFAGAASPLNGDDYLTIARSLSAKPSVRFRTERGDFVIELASDAAPVTAYRFLRLVRAGFYRNGIVHRVEPDFVAQGGDPLGTGWGGNGEPIRDECGRLPFNTHTLGLATAGRDTGETQWFITNTALPHLDGRYTAFGTVVSGGEIADRLVIGDRVLEITESLSGNGYDDFEPTENSKDKEKKEGKKK